RLWRPRPDHRRAAAALRLAGAGRDPAVLILRAGPPSAPTRPELPRFSRLASGKGVNATALGSSPAEGRWFLNSLWTSPVDPGQSFAPPAPTNCPLTGRAAPCARLVRPN